MKKRNAVVLCDFSPCALEMIFLLILEMLFLINEVSFRFELDNFSSNVLSVFVCFAISLKECERSVPILMIGDLFRSEFNSPFITGPI